MRIDPLPNPHPAFFSKSISIFLVFCLEIALCCIAAGKEPPNRNGVSASATSIVSQPAPPPIARIQDIQHLKTEDRAQVIIRLDKEARYKKARLKNPDRIFFDILNTKLNPVLLDKECPTTDDEFIRQIRVSQKTSDTARIVLDLVNADGISILERRDGFNLVIEIRAEDSAAAEKESPPDPEILPDEVVALGESDAPEMNPAEGDTSYSEKQNQLVPHLAKDPTLPMKSSISGHQPERLASPSANADPIADVEDNAPALAASDATPLASSPAEPAGSQDSQTSRRKDFFSLHGQLRNQTAYRIASPTAFSKIKNFAYLEMNGRFSQHFAYAVGTRLYYDAVFDANSAFGKNVERDQQWDAELRNAFVDISIGPMDLRLGKQQIVWGQAVNLFFADVVNPRDLREFVLPDLDDIRIPVWAGDLEFTLGNTHLEFVAIPVLDHDRIGVPGSDFTFRIPPLPKDTVLNIADIKMPANNLRNGVYGFRLSQMVKGWDLGAFYLYGYDYSPTYFRRIDVNLQTQQVTVNVMPEITRKRTVGATFSKDINGVVFKGEFVYDRERNFLVTDPADYDGIIKSDYFEYLLGMDYTFFRKVDFNVQFFQQYVLKPVDGLFRDDKASFVSVWLKTGFLNNRLEPEFFAVTRLDGTRSDFLIRPKLNYTFTSRIKAALGLDIFGGDYYGDFGQFSNSDRIYLELRYLF